MDRREISLLILLYLLVIFISVMTPVLGEVSSSKWGKQIAVHLDQPVKSPG
jgi:hypothetical protein